MDDSIRHRPAFSGLERASAESLIDLALREDLGDSGDLTSACFISEEAQAKAWFVARREGVLCGMPVVELLMSRFDSRLVLEGERDGFVLPEGRHSFGCVRGPARSILAVERTALNFLQHLSGIASWTAQFVEAVSGTRAKILDTRKTTPGWRALEKYAVRCGGGHNHRQGLYDAILIKDNHLATLAGSEDPLGAAIAAARGRAGAGFTLEIEVDQLEQIRRALECEPDIVMLDNLGPEQLREAIRLRDLIASRVLLEASGGVTLESVRTLAETGVDRISVGSLTHSAPALDIGLDFEVGPAL